MKKYTLDEFSKISEIVAAICVVASLIWVAVELRINSDEIRHSNSVKLTTFTAENQLQVVGTNLIPIIVKTNSGKKLDPVESVTLDFYFRYAFQEFEIAHFQYLQGRLDSQLAKAWDRRLIGIIKLPVGKDYWSREQNLYTQRFQAHVATVTKHPG